ncbi:MAG: transglycosylase SLT domain-containing protein [Prevotella sp.]|nr:transglycosylase SLT domain-containing protein [Prevotella sp.]
MFNRYNVLWVIMILLALSCTEKQERVVTPWGEEALDTIVTDGFDLNDIVANGELIALTISGPESYYDYRGKSLGTQYMLCQKYADHIGVRLRMEVCRDTAEMLNKLVAGDADMIAYPLPKKGLELPADSMEMLAFTKVGGDSIGGFWVTLKENDEMIAAVNEWYSPSMFAEVKKEEAYLLSAKSIRRKVFSPMLDRKGGVISHYDSYFMKYSQTIRWDWRLMAAQCYQESTFDPNAKSWAGACGLMQIMPGTADLLGLERTKMFDPESNIEAASRYIGQLDRNFSDIGDRHERINFVLAAYNGGANHVRDAMALAARDGRNAKRWREVAPYVLKLAEPKYYRDPIVKFGYMRGPETVDYVDKIHARWATYRGVKTPRVGAVQMLTPQKARRQKKKYNVD